MEKNAVRVIRICELYYSPVEDVQSISSSTYDRVVVTLKPGKTWEKLPLTAGTGTITERGVREMPGRSYEQEMACDIAGEGEQMVSWSHNHDFRPVIVKVVQNDGTKIYGDLVNPVRLRSTWSTETSSTTIGFSRKSKERGRFVDEDWSGSGS